YA
ncbi:bacterial NAD-glutamate dehydrogenase family protein, partial [Vibrio parahaemolyticus V-223/04]